MAHQPKYIGPEWVMAPLQPIAAGKTGTPQVLTGTSVKAVGKVLFSANPIADTTTTIGGVVYTWKASANASLDEVTIGGTLTLSIDALIAKIATNATLTALATYTKTDTNTAITCTMKNYGVQYNQATGSTPFVVASTTATPTVTATAGGTNEQVASLDTESTAINASLASAHAVNIYAGDEFQRKTIHLAAKTGAGGAVVTGVFQGGTTLTFDAVGDFVELLYLNAKWQVVTNVSVTLA